MLSDVQKADCAETCPSLLSLELDEADREKQAEEKKLQLEIRKKI